jgi:exopolyphosphatase/guanosine-5'-triphosphate,3'-diphosphate pyrophosphatase
MAKPAPAPQAHPDFPLRVAAIDIGSNAIRFSAAEFLDRTRRIELQVQRVPVRMGHSAFVTGSLAPESIDAAIQALAGFRRHMDTLDIQAYRAVATSAVRESGNARELVQRAHAECGIDVEAITGGEEARLVWLAVRDRLSLDGRWMHVDLGGGSLEVSVVHDAGIEWTESHSMGTVRLLEELDVNGTKASKANFGPLLAEYASTLRLPSLAEAGLEGLVATGGNIESLAALAGAKPDSSGVSRLSVSELKSTIDRLSGMTVAQRIEQLGLREDRADVIVPAGLLYQRVAKLAGAKELLVPHVGVKDGVLLDLIEDLTTHDLHETRQERDVRGAALALGRRYRFDEAHAVQVANLSLSLFDQLDDLHELITKDRRILLGAALLHDIGQFVSYRKHHKHSMYLILHGELSVYSPAEIKLVALVARYHRGADPKPEHELWGELKEDDRERVIKLAALLRVADSLDRQHLQQVTAVRAEVHDDVVALEVEAQGDLLLERWALERKGKLFEKAFEKAAQLGQLEEVA